MFSIIPKNTYKTTILKTTEKTFFNIHQKQKIINQQYTILNSSYLTMYKFSNFYHLKKKYIFSKSNCFKFSNKTHNNDNKTDEDYEKEIKRELQKSDKERERLRKLEEWKKFQSSVYTKEEYEIAIKDKDEIIIIEISKSNKRKLYFSKYFCVFFNIPMSLFITFFIDSFLPTWEPGNKRLSALYYGLMAVDYILFANGILILNAINNVCLVAKFLPKEQLMEFTKLGLFCKPYVIKEKLENIKRTNPGIFSPFNSLKSKETNNYFALKGIGEWKEMKLFNYLFPHIKKREVKSGEINRRTKNKEDLIK